ncbi:MAG: SulP family inorganic anion transporter [Myxococcota bacterium]
MHELVTAWQRDWRIAQLREELGAALAVTVVGVPQGVAYAVVAGLPPIMGLFAGALPAIVASAFRSSRHVVTGPTNALSLLVGTTVAVQANDPVAAATTLAVMIGLIQVAAGGLRLGSIVDYVSAAVVTGYVTGAGILIAVGQLPALTGIPRVSGDLITQLWGWVSGLSGTHLPSLALGLLTVAALLLARQRLGKSGAAILAVVGSGVLVWALGARASDIALVGDLAATESGLPSLTWPDFSLVDDLWPVAFAGVLLSLVESTSVARSIASKTGQRLSLQLEFIGTGLANLVAGLGSGYPVSGSLARSTLNVQSGARTRFSGMLSGALMLVVLLGLGPLVDRLPMPALAGLIVVIAADLVDFSRIRRLLRATFADRLAFLGTLLGTFALPLDQAIAVGVGINLVLFLRQSQWIVVRELRVNEDGLLQEVEPDAVVPGLRRCPAIRILHLEGPLFFGAAGALDDALTEAMADPAVRVVVVRLKRASGLDFTTAEVFAQAHRRMVASDRRLMLVGLRPKMIETLARSGVAEALGDAVYPTQPGWFVAMREALAAAVASLPPHHPEGIECPVATVTDPDG